MEELLEEQNPIYLEYLANVEQQKMLDKLYGQKQDEIEKLKTQILNDQASLETQLTVVPKYNFLQRLFQRRKIEEEKQEHERNVQERQNALEQAKKDVVILEENLETIRKAHGQAYKRMCDLDRKPDVARGKAAEQLRANLQYDENGILVLDDSNPEQIQSGLNLKFDKENFSLSQIALVHATNYFPHNHTIKTSRDSDVMSSDNNAYVQRNTIHFALNGKVSSHAYGSWDDSKFIIIEPMEQQMGVLTNVRPEDTWSQGTVHLSEKAVILINEKEYDTMDTQTLEDYNVVKFRGDSKVATEKMLLLLGYQPQDIGMWNWQRCSGDYENELLQHVWEHYPEVSTTQHWGTQEANIEKATIERDKMLSEIRGGAVIDSRNGMLITPEEAVKMYEGLLYDKYLPNVATRYGIRITNNGFFMLSGEQMLNERKYEESISYDKTLSDAEKQEKRMHFSQKDKQDEERLAQGIERARTLMSKKQERIARIVQIRGGKETNLIQGTELSVEELRRLIGVIQADIPLTDTDIREIDYSIELFEMFKNGKEVKPIEEIIKDMGIRTTAEGQVYMLDDETFAETFGEELSPTYAKEVKSMLGIQETVNKAKEIEDENPWLEF